ncbi:hypothetical protein FEDK69T_05970 [Flavobacterium enshiense DK69]|uniref:SdpI/YhfL protein family n=1 Tax=Flavobacterium enshiense DK69 TaxID=1107311 RepID=V6SD55_9FLAO|nr:SdpI family protein [Flavobacterium enshiense]ESU24162.1 hypothetical protein FEDK69T_05970 [Flavobacterium enshiense DK69]KGO95460.1 hypothetical protein Q767_11710 [Flavobacterium enshiense DK69]
MDWTANVLQMPLLCGIIFMIAGLVMYLFPPKKINSLYGYRTSSSMKSQQTWDFAQRFSAIKLLQIGAVLGLLTFLQPFFGFEKESQTIIGIALTLAAVLSLLMLTERAIKNKFPNT